jgi:hypothetical protein
LAPFRFPTLLFFAKSCPNSQKGDGQLTFKFDMKQNTIHIHQIMLEANFSFVVCVFEGYFWSKTATDWGDSKVGDSSNNAQPPWHNLIDRKHIFSCVEFKVRLSSWFTRESVSKKKWNFSWGTVSPFSKRRGFKCFGAIKVDFVANFFFFSLFLFFYKSMANDCFMFY